VWKGSYPTADILVATQSAVFGFACRAGADKAWRLWGAEAETGELDYVTTGTPGFDLSYASYLRPAVLAGSHLVLAAKRAKGTEYGAPCPVVCIDLGEGKIAGQWQSVGGSCPSRGPLPGGTQVYFCEDDSHVVALKVTPRAAAQE
jgi:hypothetical protein